THAFLFTFLLHFFRPPHNLHSFPTRALPISLNAFELIRIKKFSLLDEDQRSHTLRENLNSYKATIKLIDETEDLNSQLINEEARSEEHTSELQSRFDLVCRLLLEKKNIIKQI